MTTARARRLYVYHRRRLQDGLSGTEPLMIASPGVPSRIARKVINERAVLTHCPVHNTPQMEIIMNDKEIKKGMKEHITATVMGSDGNRKSFAKLSTGKWVAMKDSGDLDDFEILPDDLFTMLCIFRDSGRQVIFNDHSAA